VLITALTLEILSTVEFGTLELDCERLLAATTLRPAELIRRLGSKAFGIELGQALTRRWPVLRSGRTRPTSTSAILIGPTNTILLHVAGSLFGAAFPLLIKATKTEERIIHPKIEAKISFAAPLVVTQALESLDRGDLIFLRPEPQSHSSQS
jgi:hypothetical protein